MCEARGSGTAPLRSSGSVGQRGAAAASTNTQLRLYRTLIYDDEEKMPLDAKSCWKHITEP